MKYCNNCGSGSKNSQKFCPECGESFNTAASKIDISAVSEKATPILNEGLEKSKNILSNSFVFSKNKMLELKEFVSEKANDEEVKSKISTLIKSKKFIISACSVVSILILIMSGVMINNAMNNPERLIKKFEQSIVAKDTNSLKGLLSTDDPTLILTDLDLNNFIEYLTSKQSHYSNTLNNLMIQAKGIQNSDTAAFYSSTNSISLKMDSSGKKYSLNLTPVYFSINVPKAGTNLTLNGEAVATTEVDNFNVELGPLLPGNYKINATYKSEFVTADDELSIDTLDENTSSNYISLSVMKDAFDYVVLTSNYPDAKLFVNDTTTDITINDNHDFGPIAPDTKLHAVVTINGKEFKSSEVIYSPATYYDEISLYFDVQKISNDPIMKTDESIREDIYRLLGDYLKDFAYAVNYNSFSSIERYLDPGSKLFLEQKTNIPNINKSGIKEKFVTFKLSDLQIDSSKTTVTATVEEMYDVTYDNKETETLTFNNTYTIIFNSDKKAFLLSDLIVG